MCVSSRCLLFHLECLDPSERSDRDDIEDALAMNFYHFQNHGLGKGKEPG